MEGGYPGVTREEPALPPNVPSRHDIHRPPPRPTASSGMTPLKWAAVVSAASVLVLLSGYLFWQHRQEGKARAIPVYPGAALVHAFNAGSG